MATHVVLAVSLSLSALGFETRNMELSVCRSNVLTFRSSTLGIPGLGRMGAVPRSRQCPAIYMLTEFPRECSRQCRWGVLGRVQTNKARVDERGKRFRNNAFVEKLLGRIGVYEADANTFGHEKASN